jgi:MYXO-CTERM domain-containing protein
MVPGMNVRRSLIGLLAALSLAVPLLVVTPAHAAGTVTPAKTELEDSGGWKLFVTIKLGKKPSTAHMPVRFVFRPLVLIETFMDDSKPTEQTRLLPQDKNVTPLIISQDISFGDMQGNLWDTTKFDFTISRSGGFEAGEYQVELRDSDDKQIGQSFKLKLNGKNTLIDRRAMVFAGGEKKKKEQPTDKKTEEASKPAEDKKDGSAPPAEDKKDAGAQPPPAEAKPKGCGCQLPGSTPAESPAALVAVAAVAVGALRRRRSDRSLVGPAALTVASARGDPGLARSPLAPGGGGAPRRVAPPGIRPVPGRREPAVARRRDRGARAGPVGGSWRRRGLDAAVLRAAAAPRR